MEYDAFISYSHADCGNIAPSIQRALENIGKPWYRLKRNLTVFRDETNLSASPELWNSIVSALDNSDNLILLASPIAKDSFWVNKEIEHWFSKERAGKLYIVLSQGEITWDYNSNDFDWKKTSCLPPTLSNKFKEEPLWIDLTIYHHAETKTINYKQAGFTSSLTKVIGGIVGKPPREIESYELKQKKNTKSFLIFIFSLLIALTLFSFIQRQSAILQKNIAERQKQKAIISENNAVQNLKKFKIEEFEKNLRDAKIYLEANESGLARNALINANLTAKDTLFQTNIDANKIQFIDSILNNIEK